MTYPYVNLSFGGQVAITLAKRPTPIAIQSNAMCMASLINPKLLVHTP